jgi:hypothetical protein
MNTPKDISKMKQDIIKKITAMIIMKQELLAKLQAEQITGSTNNQTNEQE